VWTKGPSFVLVLRKVSGFETSEKCSAQEIDLPRQGYPGVLTGVRTEGTVHHPPGENG
jgi:hypothetical protein